MTEYIYETNGETVQNMLSEVFEPVQEIMRCRDCKFKDEPWNCAAPYFVEPDGYCAWGRKKDK